MTGELHRCVRIGHPLTISPTFAATDETKAFTEVVGSGPYRFLPDEYNSGSRVAYARFDGYQPRQEPPERHLEHSRLLQQSRVLRAGGQRHLFLWRE